MTLSCTYQKETSPTRRLAALPENKGIRRRDDVMDDWVFGTEASPAFLCVSSAPTLYGDVPRAARPFLFDKDVDCFLLKIHQRCGLLNPGFSI